MAIDHFGKLLESVLLAEEVAEFEVIGLIQIVQTPLHEEGLHEVFVCQCLIGEVLEIASRFTASHILQQIVDVVGEVVVLPKQIALELAQEIHTEVLVQVDDFVGDVDVALHIHVAEDAVQRPLCLLNALNGGGDARGVVEEVLNIEIGDLVVDALTVLVLGSVDCVQISYCEIELSFALIVVSGYFGHIRENSLGLLTLFLSKGAHDWDYFGVDFLEERGDVGRRGSRLQFLNRKLLVLGEKLLQRLCLPLFEVSD